MSQEWE
jgi:hypothetical protein